MYHISLYNKYNNNNNLLYNFNNQNLDRKITSINNLNREIYSLIKLNNKNFNKHFNNQTFISNSKNSNSSLQILLCYSNLNCLQINKQLTLVLLVRQEDLLFHCKIKLVYSKIFLRLKKTLLL